jgi:integrase
MDVITGVRMSEFLGPRWVDVQPDDSIFIRQDLHMTESGQFIFEEPTSITGKRKIALPLNYPYLRRTPY